MTAWALGTAGPVHGALAMATWYLVGGAFSAREAFGSIVLLAAVAIVVGADRGRRRCAVDSRPGGRGAQRAPAG